jgi:hypothetical protein
VGDSVATTTPNFGRGVTTAFLQVLQLLVLLDAGYDPRLVGEPFDEWCELVMLPWVADHVAMDQDTARRWEGGNVDLARRLPSDLILAAGAVDPTVTQGTGGYLTMVELPSSLDPVEPLAHAVYESGWRPPFSPGPTRGELRAIVAEAVGRSVG